MDPRLKFAFYVAAMVCFGVGAFRPVDRNIKFCAIHMVSVGWFLLIVPITYQAFDEGF